MAARMMASSRSWLWMIFWEMHCQKVPHVENTIEFFYFYAFFLIGFSGGVGILLIYGVSIYGTSSKLSKRIFIFGVLLCYLVFYVGLLMINIVIIYLIGICILDGIFLQALVVIYLVCFKSVYVLKH